MTTKGNKPVVPPVAEEHAVEDAEIQIDGAYPDVVQPVNVPTVADPETGVFPMLSVPTDAGTDPGTPADAASVDIGVGAGVTQVAETVAVASEHACTEVSRVASSMLPPSTSSKPVGDATAESKDSIMVKIPRSYLQTRPKQLPAPVPIVSANSVDDSSSTRMASIDSQLAVTSAVEGAQPATADTASASKRKFPAETGTMEFTRKLGDVIEGSVENAFDTDSKPKDPGQKFEISVTSVYPSIKHVPRDKLGAIFKQTCSAEAAATGDKPPDTDSDSDSETEDL